MCCISRHGRRKKERKLYAMEEEGRRNEVIMLLKEANCRNCYKCVRACPVKAISILGEHAKIQEKRCVYCGKCYLVCPQDARNILGDLTRVRKMIADGEKVYVSIASAYSTYFRGSNIRRIATALKKLGVERVEETSIGTKRVLEEYLKIIEEGQSQNLISSHCPSSNYLIQKFFPNLIRWLMPVDTPLEAHARMMRKAYGDDIRVVGIGPCIAYHKLANETDNGRLIDAYVNYEELERWMNDEDVSITAEEDPDTYAVSEFKYRYTDESGGLFRALPNQVKKKYTLWTADGVTRVASIMRDFNTKIVGHMVESVCCNNSCLGGPVVRMHGRDSFEGKTQWMDSIKEIPAYIEKKNPSEDAIVSVRKTFKRMDFVEPEPTEEEIAELLLLVGKKTKADMLDCSGCGYPTCRAKAIAVFHGMADPFMCIPHSRDSAELQSNLLFDNSPNGCLVLDQNLAISEANSAAESVLGASENELKGRAVTDFIAKDFIESSKLKETPVHVMSVKCPQIGKILNITFFKIQKRNIYMVIFEDITRKSEMIEKELAIRGETIQITKDVVEKQMIIAQEIASLLGETTAETKLAFNKLRNNLEKDESGWS